MILLGYIMAALAALAAIVLSSTHRRMNAACILHAALTVVLTVYVLLFQQVPVASFLIGSHFFFMDRLGLYEVLIASVIFTCAAVYAGGYVESLLSSKELDQGSLKLFYSSWTMLLLVLVLAFFCDNLALFWICAELTTILSALLVAILSARENIDAAIKYIFIASASMLFSFVGLIFLFETSRTVLGTGTLNWTALMQHASAFPAGMALAAFALVFMGFAAKSGIFPFHTWLPEAHAKAPSAVSAVLSAVLLNVGIYGILRVYAIVHQTTAAATIAPLLAVFGFFTVGIAAFSMLPQKNLKKLVAFSSVENMGLILIGIAVSTPLAIFWVLFHIMAHSLTKASLFFSAGILHRQYRSRLSTDADDEIRDVFRLQPLAAWGIIIGGLAITGMPLFPVFFSKLFILRELGQASMPALFLLLVLLFVIASALGYFVIAAFCRVTEAGASSDIVPYVTPLTMKIPLVLLIGLIIITGVVFTRGETAFFEGIVQELRF
ncbi:MULTISPECIES: proton-conducting transporter membrane subunit [unclassified Methanoregula]|uniref:proton-conducting transporter transmembrane domain-containing protein n=1 Tax=unclassified Methanoregula TaxID=2649730 RepID=UPI0009C9523A|nr:MULTISPECIES: proton-conducting transporter membrane subunit [unclassified Methanoregula]OPX62955.1 MAG: F(420)H(2) dehydrogenase subunit M [Methanoregula sp. PtaB.Bin085]OPY35168.1 MAG: F(420)H(2) dehydrogenase subunit M [Methanoregula sp. PtaU1.Bin006]